MTDMRRSTTDYATPAAQKTAKHLGEMVRSARLARGWSQESLAERARVSPATMNRLEQGGVNVALGTWLAALERLGLLSKLDQLRDPVSEAILEGTKTRRPIRSKPSDLDF